MPNWCFNEIEFSGPHESLEKLKSELISDGYEFNLNFCLPYPEKWKTMDEEYRVWGGFDSTLPQEEKDKLREEYIAKWGTKSDGYNSGGYDWCWDNWGTKWNIPEADWEEETPELYRAIFDTAWEPPVGALDYLAEKFPDIDIKLECSEEGMGFRGIGVWMNGQRISYIKEDIPPSEDEEEYEEMK